MSLQKDILYRISDDRGYVDAKDIAELLSEIQEKLCDIEKRLKRAEYEANCAYAEHIRRGHY